ncbi:MAG: peptidoglycan DD-metalloendopeptidase family protein [Proteobacteria bacterium]|nr:peptidoglycan DD-metalloendopeptidase family protein [Pseudomonadota bacterium]
MVQYPLYWKYFSRRYVFTLCQLATVAVAFVVVYSALFLIFRPGEVNANSTLPKTAALVPPQPNLIQPYAENPVVHSQGAEFTAKPSVSLAASMPLSDHLLSIQARIANMLEASNRMLVSEKRVMIGEGDTLMELLVKKASVPREDAYQVVQALGKVYNPRDISPGREITVFFHKDPSIADPKFSGVRIEKDPVNVLAVNRDNRGNYTVKKMEKAVHRALNGFRGTIDNSLYVDAQTVGVPDRVIVELIKMYSWNVDFQREIHSGDRFEVMYEEYKTEDGKIVHGRGNIVYAKLVLNGNSMPFYRFEDSHGDADYYDDHGRSAKKPLMKTPVDGARLSSGFGVRKHPVLGFSKMHKGVDFAAPRGTPIYAAGDGVIAKIGPFSSYGNYIRIRHRAGLETAYAHMSRFKSGLHRGDRVKQGTVIGYIGTTGRSTGPHLHYEVLVNNQQVNPASVKLPTGRALKGKELKSFQRVLAQARVKFNNLGYSTAVAENRAVPSHRPEKTAKN